MIKEEEGIVVVSSNLFNTKRRFFLQKVIRTRVTKLLREKGVSYRVYM